MSDAPEVIRDPVHNLIPLVGQEGAMIAALMGRPEFQRLRRIKQLGMGFLVYPGAEHSRWPHSLGVYHVARRMMDALRARHGKKSEEYCELARLRKEVLAAALLHDVGHGPFSHVFERAIEPPNDPPSGYPKTHEGWSIRIIREKFSDVLRDHGVDVDVVVGLIDKTNRKNLLAKDFISSQIDADRIDYLLRDSRATGTKYGDFDLDWLLHSLRIGKVNVRGQSDGVWRLCFSSRKAIHVIEEYIQAREFMYVQVYVHHTTRAYEALLSNILGLAAAIADGDASHVPSPCPKALGKMLAGEPVDTDEYLSLDDFRLWCTFIDWSKIADAGDERAGRLAGMCKRLVGREQPYKNILLRDRGKQDRALELVTNLRRSDTRFSCYRDSFADFAYRGVLYRKSKEGEEQEDRAIFFLDENARTHPAESESDLIEAISNIETTIYRLYYDETDPELMSRLRTDGWVRESEHPSESESEERS